MGVNSELLQRFWFLLLEREILGAGVSVTTHWAVAVPQSTLEVVMVMVPDSVGIPVILPVCWL